MKSLPIIRSHRTLSVTLPLSAGLLLAVPASAATVPPSPVAGGKPPASKHVVTAVPAIPEGEPQVQAAHLVSEALNLAFRNEDARNVVVKSAGPLLARLPGEKGDALGRDAITKRWLQLALDAPIDRDQRLDAFETFFESAAKLDPAWAGDQASRLPDAAGRASAYLEISRDLQEGDWRKAHEATQKAKQAAQQETDPLLRARSLVFVAFSLTILGDEGQDIAIDDAAKAIRVLPSIRDKDYLMAELVGAAAKYDLGLARTLSGEIKQPEVKKLAEARVNISEISQTTLTTRSKDRVSALATAAAPYDARALPILLQLPPDPNVLKAISQTLPPISPNGPAGLSATQLSRIWEYTKNAPEGAERDQLQSRAARLMVLHDLWRGRDWGKSLAWKGGRIQVGAFLEQVQRVRRSHFKAGALQDVAKRNVARAYVDANALPPAEHAEALLLIAGQILG